MDNISALQFRHWLDKYIQKCLKLNLTHEDIFEAIFDDHDVHEKLSAFLRTKIGQIWLRKENGLKYQTWQEGT